MIMPGRQTKIDEGSVIGARPIRYDAAWCKTLFSQQLSHQSLRCAGVSSLLNQEVQNLTLIIDGAPEPVVFAAHNNHHLVQVSAIIRARSRSTQVCGNTVSELQEPAPNCLVGDFQPTLSEQFFDVPERQREPCV